MTEHEAFLQAIRVAPNDDAPRLIYADWLEEHGQADRAEFIRLQCRIARLPDSALEKSQWMSRVEDLLRSHWEEWVGPLREIVGPRRDRYGERWMGEEYHPDGLSNFKRGFVESLTLDAEDFLRHARQLKRLAPIRWLRLWGAGRCAIALAQEPALAGHHSLDFADYYDAPLTARDMAALADSSCLEGLVALRLGRNSLGDEGVEILALAPWIASLGLLDLTDNGLSDRGARALADSPYLVNLQILWLRKNTFTSKAIAALRNSPNLRRILQLEYDPPAGNLLL